MLSEDELDEGIKEIPPLPIAITESMTLLNHKVVDFEKLQHVITQDAGLSGRVLKVANSSFYGLSGKVGSIKEACVVLGTHTLKNIILAIGMIGKFPPNSGINLDLTEMWYHAYCTGVTARLLAHRAGVDQEKAFTAGLLHDIGKMVLDVYFNSHYSEVISYQKENDCLIVDAEEKVLGVTHSQVGGKLATCWSLPEDIVFAISGHHNTEESLSSPLNDIVHLADVVSRSLDYGHAGDTLIPVLDEGVLNRLDLTVNYIGDELTAIDTIMSSATELLG